MPDRTCAACPRPIPAGSRQDRRYCSKQCRNAAQPACAEPGCDQPRRAKGLCSTHYNLAHQPGRHRRIGTTCVVCGTAVDRSARHDRRPTCSPRCRAALQDGTYHPERGWADHAARRARAAGATVVHVFHRLTVFERDAWICQICGTSTVPAASIYDPLSPTVDHVVPLSRGGQHTLANVQCAHLRCNSLKQDTIGSPQG